MRSSAILLLVLLAGSCTSGLRAVQIERASAFYAAVGDVSGALYVEGREVARCGHSWLPQVVCEPTTTWVTDETLTVELAVDGTGLARAEIEPSKLANGTHFALLDGSDGVFAASITFTVRVEPILPMQSAVVLYLFGGVALAFALWSVLRARFLTPEDERVRGSFALITAIVALAGAWIAMMPLADHSRELDPTVLAIPSGLGAYAIAAVLIDGFARRRASGKRILLGLVAMASIAMLPWAMTITVIPTSYVIIAALVALLLVLLP